jgi:hypothetical protein
MPFSGIGSVAAADDCTDVALAGGTVSSSGSDPGGFMIPKLHSAYKRYSLRSSGDFE